ncbi:hypothetical protein M427DRAFT_61384 [Gonapodya prolifera JEL478]|uniref:Uncharacterized protein n=1 Tax=Gonapodya prolifera (strain JEL478) TaxID=1344416 RepID=A0A139A3A5_GONPJ|nr:hypothetical protein M427DRAFT_61384 [Gonapodya prolifera JEL478]|eukprot:KXS10863.1 hypothetical protein M427DRAFT_61384 [Gonapodya prolifera JEL478]
MNFERYQKLRFLREATCVIKRLWRNISHPLFGCFQDISTRRSSAECPISTLPSRTTLSSQSPKSPKILPMPPVLPTSTRLPPPSM